MTKKSKKAKKREDVAEAKPAKAKVIKKAKTSKPKKGGVELSKKALRLIKEIDAHEVAYVDAKEAMDVKLHELRKEIGGPTFVHPQRGEMTVVPRGDKIFWRQKPEGFNFAGLAKAKAKKGKKKDKAKSKKGVVKKGKKAKTPS